MPWLAAGLVMLSAATAVAQSATDRKAAADAQFREAKRLFDAGEISEACAMFEASLQQLDQLGTRLNLARCYKTAGRTASAWDAFRAAAAIAARRGDPRVALARKEAADLEPRLVRLTIAVPPRSQLRDLEVTRNGAAVPPEQFDIALPVDPGQYEIDARAPGHQPWSTTIDASGDGSTPSVEIPALAPDPPPSQVSDRVPQDAPHTDQVLTRPVAPPPGIEADPRTRHRLAYIIGAAGLVGLGTGAALGIAAHHKWHEADGHCDGEVCDATGLAINRSARSLGTVGTIVGGIGLTAAVTAAVIYLTAPSAFEHAGVAPLPHAGAMVSWRGAF